MSTSSEKRATSDDPYEKPASPRVADVSSLGADRHLQSECEDTNPPPEESVVHLGKWRKILIALTMMLSYYIIAAIASGALLTVPAMTECFDESEIAVQWVSL